VDVEEIPRGVGVAEEFLEQRVVWGGRMGHGACHGGMMKVRSCLHSMLLAMDCGVSEQLVS
jgi:hypothetical protein